MPHRQYIHKPTVIKDLKVLIVVNIILLLIASQFDILEWIYNFSRQYEGYELDEVFILGFTLGCSFLVFSYRRIKELGLMAQTLEQMSLVDPLSGLPNRRAGQVSLISWCEQAEKTQQPFVVYQIDLDNFKKVNDMYSQMIGDEVLQHVALKLHSAIPNSAKLCRWLDDNFIVIVPLRDVNTPNEFAHDLQNCISGKIMTNTINLTCCIGYCTWSASQTVEGMLHDTEDALMHAKHQGENSIHNA